MSYVELKDKIEFLYKLKEGKTPSSFGIHVAKSVNIPVLIYFNIVCIRMILLKLLRRNQMKCG